MAARGRAAAVAMLLVAAALPQATRADTVTPINKVIQMLNGMMAKGREQKHEEEVEFAKYHEWCNNIKFEKTKSIDEADGQMKQLTADIAKAESDAEELAAEVKDLEGAVAKAEADIKSAKAVRDKENADYRAELADFEESIDACERAVQVLKAKSGDVKQSLAQIRSSPKIPARERAVVESFMALQTGSGGEALAESILNAPEANAYEFQSGGVVDMLEKLTAKFKEEKLALEKAEMNAKHNYNMLMQQLTDNNQADKAAISQKTAAKAGRIEDAATAKGDLSITTKAKADDEKTLSDTTAECEVGAKEFEKNQVLRAEELKALKGALDVMSSDAVQNSEQYLPTLIQKASPKAKTALAQLRSSPQVSNAQRKAAAYLQDRAAKLGSQYLSVMATHVADDPFAKVRTMIKDLLAKLMEEANEEADHHAWCQSELATNKQTRDDKSAEVEDLSAEVDSLTAETSRLAAEIAQLGDAISEIKASQVDANKLRNEEKATNAKTTADAREAQTAVELAIEILRKFYAKTEDSASAALLQGGNRQHAKAPYTGMSGSGVIGMLEVILSDFARLESETTAEEDQAQAAFEKFMAEANTDAEVKATEQEHKVAKKDRKTEMLRSSEKELELTQDELAKALDYYDKLKTDCLDKGLSYEERVKARQEEIESLKEALRILEGEEIA